MPVPGSAAQMMVVGRARARRNIVSRQVKRSGRSRGSLGESHRQPHVVRVAGRVRVPYASIGTWVACCVGGEEVLHVLWVGLRCFACEGRPATPAAASRHPP